MSGFQGLDLGVFAAAASGGLSRRTFLGAAPALALRAGFTDQLKDSAALLGPGADWGVFAVEAGSGRRLAGNPDLRLPMCSSFKWLLAASLLWRADHGQARLDRRVLVRRSQLMSYAPATRAAVERAGGREAAMSLAELCQAAVTLSDNTAANLLLAESGGPAALTAWLRAHGDAVTRLDRNEPALNDVPRGDPRDTTTAAAMVGDLQRYLYGPVLSPASRKQLFDWLLGCQTGTERLRAGLPPGWRIAHKTGTRDFHPGVRAAAGDVGVLIPPRGAPILVAAYTAGSERPQAQVDRWFAQVAARLTAPGAFRAA